MRQMGSQTTHLCTSTVCIECSRKVKSPAEWEMSNHQIPTECYGRHDVIVPETMEEWNWFYVLFSCLGIPVPFLTPSLLLSLSIIKVDLVAHLSRRYATHMIASTLLRPISLSPSIQLWTGTVSDSIVMWIVILITKTRCIYWWNPMCPYLSTKGTLQLISLSWDMATGELKMSNTETVVKANGNEITQHCGHDQWCYKDGNSQYNTWFVPNNNLDIMHLCQHQVPWFMILVNHLEIQTIVINSHMIE